MRRKDETLRAELLGYAREIAEQEGPEAINIRRIASRAGIAVGTVYHYFSDKEDLLLSLTEESWQQALGELRETAADGPFVEQVRELYAFLYGRIEASAGRLMGSLHGVKAAGRERMDSVQKHLRAELLERLERDAGIDEKLWGGVFTKEAVAGFVIETLMRKLQAHERDISFFLELLRRTLYAGREPV